MTDRFKYKFILCFSLPLVLLVCSACADEDSSDSTVDWKQRLERLRAVPYVGVSDRPVEEEGSGVVFHDAEKACEGYFLYCNRLTGDAFLLDVNGQVAHQWKYPANRKEGSEPEVKLDDHVILLANGDLLVQKKFMELLKIDWNSQLLWRERLDVHHDMAVAPDGSYYVILREFRSYRNLQVRFPAIVHLTADGKELDRWSAYEHLAEMTTALDPVCSSIPFSTAPRQEVTWMGGSGAGSAPPNPAGDPTTISIRTPSASCR